jgi:hypothetical protein
MKQVLTRAKLVWKSLSCDFLVLTPLRGKFFKQFNRQLFNCRYFFMLARILILFGVAATPVFADPQILTLQRLDFGILAVRANAVPSTLTLSPQGAANYGSAFVSIATGTPGRYRLTGYPAFTDISVTMSASTITLASGVPGESFSVAAPITKPLTLRTDINGQVDFDLGASLTTSGSNVLYQDGAYVGHAGLTLTFNVAEVAQFSNQPIDVDVVLRTNLAVAESEKLNFGRLVVFSSAVDQASMNLAPNGQVNILNPGAARIIRFGSETPATFQVTTGAAYAPVTLTLPSSTVYLTHQSLSPDVARLLVTDFVSLPTSANAKLDANGALEFRVGATLRTEQTAKRYQDGVYSGAYLLDVEY